MMTNRIISYLLAPLLCSLCGVLCFTSIGNGVYNHNDINTLSAHSDRREFIQTTFTKFGIAVIVPSISILPSNANADAGSSANMKLPNYIDFLIEKNAQGLVENPDKLLYKGPDVEVLYFMVILCSLVSDTLIYTLQSYHLSDTIA